MKRKKRLKCTQLYGKINLIVKESKSTNYDICKRDVGKTFILRNLCKATGKVTEKSQM